MPNGRKIFSPLTQQIILLFFFLALTLAALSCASGPAPWVKRIDGETSRFQIDVFQFEGYSREQNLEATRRFASLWKKKSGFEYFIQDPMIIESRLKSGRLIPSTNYLLGFRPMVLGKKHIANLTVLNKETGEILASARIEADGLEALIARFEAGIDRLLHE